MEYTFGTYRDTPDGKEFETVAIRECDSDAQAELEARNLGPLDDLLGLYVNRGDSEWFVRF